MNKIIILTAVTTIFLTGSTQQAWAGHRSHREDDDYHAFRKIVHILDDLINDDYRRGRKDVKVRKYTFPRKKVCYYRGPFEVCREKRRGHPGRGLGLRKDKHVQKKHDRYYSRW